MEIGNIVGWLGVGFGLFVPVPQLVKLLRCKQANGVSLGTYIALFFALSCYFAHALYIGSPVFAVAQGVNLTTNGAILVILLKRRRHGV